MASCLLAAPLNFKLEVQRQWNQTGQLSSYQPPGLRLVRLLRSSRWRSLLQWHQWVTPFVCVVALISLSSSVQFCSRWYLCAWKSPYALHPISQKFPQRCFWNGSNVRLIDDGPLSSFQGRYCPILPLLTQTFSFSPNSLAGVNRIPIITMSEPLIGSSWPSVPQEQEISTVPSLWSFCPISSLTGFVSHVVLQPHQSVEKSQTVRNWLHPAEEEDRRL